MKKTTIIGLILIILTFNFVLAYNSVVEVIDNNIGEFNYSGYELKNVGSMPPAHHITYQDARNTISKIVIFEFSKNNDDYNNIASLNHMADVWRREGSGSLNYGDNIVYYGDNNREIFWTHDNLIVVVKGVFSTEIINAYLEIYPSYCSDVGCVQPTSSDISKFKKIVDFSKRVNSYSPLLIPCEDGLTISMIGNKISKYFDSTDHISEVEFSNMLDGCKEKYYFEVPAKAKSESLNNCISQLDGFLAQTEELSYDDEDLLTECILRDSFKEWLLTKSGKQYNEQFFGALFEERDIEFINNLKSKYEYKYAWKMTMEDDNGKIVKKLVRRKKNCSAQNFEEEIETEEDTSESCYEEKILEILSDNSAENETKADNISENEIEIPATKPDVQKEERELRFMDKLLNFMKSKLNPLNWFD